MKLTSGVNVHTCKPSDIRKFLIFKDHKGKTKVHTVTCNKRSDNKCHCPLRLSAGSVDSLIGQLRAIFRDLGKGSIWNDAMNIGNPAASSLIKNYLSAVRLEQSQACNTPKQATPLFLDKLTLVSRHISYSLNNPRLSTVSKYVLIRDITFFNVLAFSGDRVGDLGLLMPNSLRWLPDESGVAFTLSTGKTVDIRDPRIVILYKSEKTEICPVRHLQEYVRFCQAHDIDLSRGYMFRTVNTSKNMISENPYNSSASNVRLKLYLNYLNIFEGETTHGTRSGCALTLAWLGVDSEKIKTHIGWKSHNIFKHYTFPYETRSKHESAKVFSECPNSITRAVASKMKNMSDLKSFVNL